MTRLLFALCTLHPAATASPDAVAVFREGSITKSELSSWRRFLGRSGPAEGESLQRDVESLVVLRVLAAAAEREGLLAVPDGRAAEEQLARELAVAALRTQWRESSLPGDAAVRAEYEALRETYQRPRRWELRNILLRAPAGVDRDAIRRRAAEIRAEAAGGKDFGALAEAHSESTTRFQKGRMGWITLDRLDPRLAAVVEKLDQGALSEVLETEEGFILLYCSAVQPAETVPFERVRVKLGKMLHSRLIGARRERLIEDIRATTSLEPVTGPRADGDAPVFRYRGLDGTSRPVSLAEYRAFLRSRSVEEPDSGLAEQDRERLRGELLNELGFEAEARRLGLLDTPEFHERWGWEQLRAHGHEVFASRARKAPPITAREIAAYYEANRANLVLPESFRISSIELHIGPDTPRDAPGRARTVAAELAAGKIAWSEAASSIDATGKWVGVKDLGWMRREDFFHLGPSGQGVAEGLRPGGTSDLFQDGRRLKILRMDERRASQAMTLAEATEPIRRRIMQERNQAAQDALTAEILGAQKVVLLDTGGPPP